jgi:hypothetical protein
MKIVSTIKTMTSLNNTPRIIDNRLKKLNHLDSPYLKSYSKMIGNKIYK